MPPRRLLVLAPAGVAPETGIEWATASLVPATAGVPSPRAYCMTSTKFLGSFFLRELEARKLLLAYLNNCSRLTVAYGVSNHWRI